MPLALAGNAELPVIFEDSCLNVIKIRRDIAEPCHFPLLENLVERQHGGRRGNSRRRCNLFAKPDVCLKPQPAGGCAVPSDRVDLRMRQ